MRIVVVEDEEVVADRLIRLIGKILGDRAGSVTHLPTLDDAIEHVARQSIDLLFLDLDLNGRDGFRLLRQAVAGAFQTIVVSARHDQALQAFEHGVTDFVPKPYDEDRLRKAISRVTDRDESTRRQLRFLAVRHAGEIVPVPVDDVLFVQGAGDYSEIHCKNGESRLHDKTLNALEHLLPARFERVHRSYIVDTKSIESYRSEPGSRYFLRLATGQEIPIGRIRFKALKRKML